MSSDHVVIKREDDGNTKHYLIPLLEIYLDKIYGDGLWDEMLLDDTFSDLIAVGFLKYGDLILHDAINMICEKNNIMIADLLMDFGSFVHDNYS